MACVLSKTVTVQCITGPNVHGASDELFFENVSRKENFGVFFLKLKMHQCYKT